jgi:hypothetical protein
MNWLKDLSGGDYKKLKQCKYCEQMYSEGDLLQRLSLQNIINLDLHMIVIFKLILA